MKTGTIGLLSAAAIAASIGAAALHGQDTADAHVAAAKAAAGQEHQELFKDLCTPSTPRPASKEWHAEPVKVFDNLYFVGQTQYSAWAVTTSAGIIIVDTIFDYSVDDEIVGGLKKLGLDPSTIKYAIVSHGHNDHVGGAKYLQDRFGAHVVMSAADWDLVERTLPGKPKRDMIATDGQQLTLGDTTLTLYLTPGHTLGTISTLIPVKDGGTPHLVAEWGGTGFNWLRSTDAYITPDRPARFWFDTYIKSAERFRDVVAKAGADAIIANHTHLDGTPEKIRALGSRKPGGPHPYVIGNDAVKRYVTVAEECAKAGLTRLK